MTFHYLDPEQAAADAELLEAWRESRAFTDSFLEYAEQQDQWREQFEHSDSGARALERWEQGE